MSLHLKGQIFLGQIPVTFARSRCLYLDAQSEDLSGLVDLQQSSLDFVPGLAANAAEDAKGREEIRAVRTGRSGQHQCKVPAADTDPFFTQRPVNSTGNYS